MNKSTVTVKASPTGRITVSQPEVQHFPGTPEAIALQRRMKDGMKAAGDNPSFMPLDFSETEKRVLQSLYAKAR